MKSSATVAILAFTSVAAATVPGCLIAGINKQPSPSDYKSICGPKASQVKSDISAACGNDELTKVALKDFADSCKAQGYPLDGSKTEDSASSTQSATKTAHSTVTTTGTASDKVTATGTAKTATTTDGDKPTTVEEADSDCTTATGSIPAKWAATTTGDKADATATGESGASNSYKTVDSGSSQSTKAAVPGAAKPTGFTTVSKPAGPLVTGSSGSGNGNGNGDGNANASNIPSAPHAPSPEFTGAGSSIKLSTALALVAGVAAFFL
ncbi:hypothetical protein KEM54_005478 [Ascosphaera aggregata]|nr:hypothetical protein KEM54_005478 [Ascosphaera aggregata]